MPQFEKNQSLVENGGNLAPEVSVIICAYTEQRWQELAAAVASIRGQALPPKELILVIDHNPSLYERARQQFAGALVIENQGEKGLSGARNTGLAIASGAVIAFMDEDAVAEPDWLACLLAGYADPTVLGVGGAIEPLWLAGRPGWFPEEFDWVVGCTYKGLPETPASVRNLIGANMSFRASLRMEGEIFRTGLGRVDTLPLGCEETEFCIRARQRRPGGTFLYDPRARVRHRVPAGRGTLRYFGARCFSEGISKAMVASLVGAGDGLASERRYTLRTLPRGVRSGLASALRGEGLRAGLGRALAIAAGLGITGLGYAWGRFQAWRKHLQAEGGCDPRRGPQPAGVATRSSAGRSAAGQARPRPQRPLRVLMVTPRFYPQTGGVENHVGQVSRRLAARGVQISVLTGDPTGRLPLCEEVEGVRVQRVRAWPANSDLYFAPGLYRAIRAARCDLIHLQSYHTFVAPLAMLAALRAGVPYVVTFHGGGHSSRLRNAIRVWQRALLAPLLRRAARLVALAQFEIEQYSHELGIEPECFSLIPNGSDLPPAYPAARAAAPGPLIASVGRLERYKGHQRILAAMPYILREKPTARLWIAGSGPYEPELTRLAEALGVQAQVEIRAIPLADRGAMANELSRASLFVLLSDFETHPIAVLEAVSLGVPALVADTSGLSELAARGIARAVPLTRDGRKTGGQQIARAVLDQLDHPIRPPALALPTWDDCAAGLHQLYQTLLGSTNGDHRAYSDADSVLSADPWGD